MILNAFNKRLALFSPSISAELFSMQGWNTHTCTRTYSSTFFQYLAIHFHEFINSYYTIWKIDDDKVYM